MDHLLLRQYTPKSMLVTKEHFIPRAKYPVFDVHTHWGTCLLGDRYEEAYTMDAVIAIMDAMNIRRVVNLDGMWGAEQERMLKKMAGYEDRIVTFGSADFRSFQDSDFSEKTEAVLKENYKRGVKGIKIYNEFGLGYQNVIYRRQSDFIRPDDKRLNVVWDTAAQLDIPVLIHIANPRAFFHEADACNERVEEMCKYTRSSGAVFPPPFYSYEELMDMQEGLLYNNPHTTFIIAHVGSSAENLAFVSRCLDQYPNAYIDISERIAELGRQPYTARDFLIKYQDRILFGSDAPPTRMMHEVYFRFLETRDEYFNYCWEDIPVQGRWRIYGVYLPDEVLEKIYYKNAEKIILKNETESYRSRL